MMPGKKKKASTGEGKMGISHETYRTIIAVVDDRVKEIKVTRKDFNDLNAALGSLAEAQRRTEEKIESLAEAQKRTEAKLEALIDTVHTMHEDLIGQIKGLDRRVEGLERKVEKTDKVVGGISNTLGYALENEVYRHLPLLLEKRYGIRIEEKFIRREVTFDDKKKGEINIFGTGTKDGKKVLILGEVESKLGTDTIDELVSKSGNLKRSFPHEHFLLAATHYCRPEVADHAAGKGVVVFMTYELM
jgi:predicted RNase H-like nuclease (RuvC/YqgF family)